MASATITNPMGESTNVFSNPPARQNFFGSPRVDGNPTPFSLIPSDNGRSRFSIDSSSMSSPYFRASKRSRNNDGSYSGRPSGVGGMGAPGLFGKPSLEAVPTVGFMSNHTVPGNSTFIRSVDKADELPGPNDVVILRVNSSRERQRWKVIGDTLVDDSPRDAWTIASFNRFLAINQKKVKSIDQLDPLVDPTALNWNDPASILTHFYVYGIVEDGDTVQNRTFTPRIGDSQHFSGSEDRRVGVVISGRKQCFNLWGPNIPAGASLFLILKPIPLPASYTTNGHDRMNVIRRILTRDERESLKDKPFQLVPYASMLKRPPRSELRYINEKGQELEAPFIVFSTGYKHPEKSDEYNPMLAARDITFSRNQGLIDVMVHGAI